MGTGQQHGGRRALVLGGGGVTGIAWEAGVLAALADEGVDVRDADVVIGTSAGAVVGARLLGDPDFAAFATAQASEAPEASAAEDRLAREVAGRFGSSALRLGRRPRLGWLPGLWVTGLVFRATTLLPLRRLRRIEAEPWPAPAGPPDPLHAKVGRLARVAPAVTEERWLEIVTEILGPAREWPDRLRVTAIDAVDGRLVAFDASCGAPLGSAVAASASVPALFPPVVIDGRPYIDGGITSETNCLLASGHDEVLILAPLDRPILDREVQQLRSEGARVTVIRPSEAARAALGSRVGVLDPIRRAGSARAGYADGRAAAAVLPGTWGRGRPGRATGTEEHSAA
jgi:NTE family protein